LISITLEALHTSVRAKPNSNYIHLQVLDEAELGGACVAGAGELVEGGAGAVGWRRRLEGGGAGLAREGGGGEGARRAAQAAARHAQVGVGALVVAALAQRSARWLACGG